MSIEKRKQKALDAGLEIIRKADFDWASGITFNNLANDSGVDQKTISADFGNKENYIQALIEYSFKCFTDSWPEDSYKECLETINDPQLTPIEVMIKVSSLIYEQNTNCPNLSTLMLYWGLSGGNEKIASHLDELYEHWDELGELIFFRMMERFRSQGYKPLPGFKMTELVLIANVVIEGLAVHARVRPNKVPNDLIGRWICSLFMHPDDGD